MRHLLSVLAVLILGAAGAYHFYGDDLAALQRTQPGAASSAETRFETMGDLRVAVSVAPDPPRVGENRITVLVRNANDEPVSGALVRTVAEMPAMGAMPAMYAPAEFSETAPGRYEGRFELAMSGEWPLGLEVEAHGSGRAVARFDMATGRKGLRNTATAHGASADGDSAAAFFVDERRRQMIGVTTGEVARRRLVLDVRAVGAVTYDETRLHDVSLKFDGWIGRLHADYVGVPVRKGQPLFTVYGPALLAAQEEYLEVMRRGDGPGRAGLAEAARQRLALWDLAPSQIDALRARGRPEAQVAIMAPASGTVVQKNVVAGSAVTAGQTVLRIADLGRVWVEAHVYENELRFLREETPARVVIPALPATVIDAKVAYVYPFMEGASRTARVRLVLDNPDGLLRPDMYAEVHFALDVGERVVVPEQAVLHAGDTRVVFVDLGEGRLRAVRVRTGLRTRDWIEVLEGVAPGERVVTSGNFLIASESKLKSGLSQW